MEDKIYSILIELKKDINYLKEEISYIKSNIHLDEVKLENFIFLENGYKLESTLISECLSKHHIDYDLKLLLKVYNIKNIPIKKNNNKIYYYENSWILDNNNHVVDTLINNLINTYMVFVKEDKTRFLESKWEINLTYINKLQTNKTYRNKIFKEFLNKIYND